MEPSADEFIPTRATLLQRLKNWQDQASWQDFFDTYWKLIYSIARKGGLNEAEAQDVVQETMLSVARQMPTFKYDPSLGAFKSWLFNLTRWRIVDQIRKRTLPPLDETSIHETPPGNAVPEDIEDPNFVGLETVWQVEWEENLLQAAIERVKRRLDPERYQVFDLCVNRGWQPAKVAKTFGISVDQVYLAKHRVTEMIKEEIKRLETEMT